MALNAYLELKGGGVALKGASRFKGREDQIVVIGMRHDIVSDRDTNGMPTGGAKHRALTIVKDLDPASPGLQQALDKNVELRFKLDFQRFPPKGGPQETHASIELINARVASIRLVMPNYRVAENAAIPEYEEVSFTYDAIKWAWNGAGDESTSGNWGEANVDFADVAATWVEDLEAKIEEKIKAWGVVGGNAATEALQEAFTEALKEPEPPK